MASGKMNHVFHLHLLLKKGGGLWGKLLEEKMFYWDKYDLYRSIQVVVLLIYPDLIYN